MRFSLKTMLAASAFIAVSVAGLKYASLPWAAFFYTGSFLLVLTGVVGSLVCPWPARAFWIGFAVFGGGYFWLAYLQEERQQIAVPGSAAPEAKLATTQILLWADQQLRPPTAPPPGVRRTFIYPASVSSYLVQVGHGIFTVLLALVGGGFGKLFARLRRQSDGA